jgi:hypothetical protein
VLTYAIGLLERTVTIGKESQRAVRSALADAEERLAEMKTRVERSELLVTILTDAVARGEIRRTPVASARGSSNIRKRGTKKKREKKSRRRVEREREAVHQVGEQRRKGDYCG